MVIPFPVVVVIAVAAFALWMSDSPVGGIKSKLAGLIPGSKSRGEQVREVQQACSGMPDSRVLKIAGSELDIEQIRSMRAFLGDDDPAPSTAPPVKSLGE